MISIIVPIYNAEKVLAKCLESILSQQFSDIEILLINDGSTDSSLNICQEYAQKDRRIKVIDIPNGGVSNARNVGINNSRGEYIAFVDADDYIESDMYSKLLMKMNNTNAEIAFCGYFCHTIRRTTKTVMFESTMAQEQIINEFIPKFISSMSINGNEQRMYGGAVWRCLFKASMIKNNKINFNPKLKIAEDLIFLLNALSRSNIVCFVNLPLYNYVRNESIATTQKYISGFEQQIDYYYSEIDKIFYNYNYNYNYERLINLAKIQSFYALIKNYCKKDSGFNFKEVLEITDIYAKNAKVNDKIELFRSNELYCIPKIFRFQFRLKFYFIFVITSYLRERLVFRK